MKRNRKRFLSAVTAMLLVVAMCIQPVAGAEDFSFSIDIGDGMDTGMGDGTQSGQGTEEVPDAGAGQEMGEIPGSGQGTGETPDTGTGQGTEEAPDAGTDQGTDSGEEVPEFGSGSESEPEIQWGDDSEIAEEITVAAFDELAEEVKNREVTTGTPLEELGLPEALGISEIRAEASEAQPGMVENITWKADPENPVNQEHGVTEYLPDQEGVTVFTPVLPQNYVLAEGVALPEITVQVKKQEILIAEFDPLDAEIQRQRVKPGTALEALNLPTALGASSVEKEGAMPQSITVENVTWKVDPEQEINKKRGVTEYQPDKEEYTVFTAVLPENYTVLEDVKLPEIIMEVSSLSAGVGYSANLEGTGDPTAFAMKNKLQNGFDTITEDDGINRPDHPVNKEDFKWSQQVFFGKDYQGEPQKWWVTGTDPANPENLVLFASDTLLKPMQFDEDIWVRYYFQVDSNGKYHFGTWENSNLRNALITAKTDEKLFSLTEQNLMLPSNIKTLDRAALFRMEHPDMPVDAWNQLTEQGLGWEYYTIFKPLGASPDEIHYAMEEDLYYETEDVLYAPYGEHEYAFPTVGSGYGTRASTGRGNAISGSFFAENIQSNQGKSGNGKEAMPFWLRTPGTDYAQSDSGVGAEWHEAGRDSALLAGNFNQDSGGNTGTGIVIAYDPETQHGGNQQDLYTNKEYAVQPAFQLDTTNVLFGSVAEAAVKHATEVANGDALAVSDAMTLRYDAKGSLGTATVTESKPDRNGKQHQQVEIKGAPNGTYLVVQNIMDGWDAGAWAIPVKGDTTVNLSDVTIGDQTVQEAIDSYEKDDEDGLNWGSDGFPSQYRIWLEKTEDEVTKASLAEYRVSVEGNEHITVNYEGETTAAHFSVQDLKPKSTYDPDNGYGQSQDTWIWEQEAKAVICTAEEGYYFPSDYLNKNNIEARKYGVEAAISEDGKTLTVTFDHDIEEEIFYLYAPYAARTIVLPTPEKIPQNLTISKTVVEDGAAAEEISSKAASEGFNFTLSLKDEGGNPLEDQQLEITDIDGTTGTMSLKDGSAAFTLAHGQKITVTGLPNGITYEITETPVEQYSPQYEISYQNADHTKSGEIISSESSSGDAEASNTAEAQEVSAQGETGVQKGATATGTIPKGQDVTVAYTNTYTPGYPVSFTKVDKDTKAPLKEVEFKLYTCSNTQPDHTHSELAGEDSIKAGCWKPIQTEGQDREYISDSNGKVDLGILETGEYMLQETKTVSGYVLPKGQWLMTVADKGTVSFQRKGDDTTPDFEQKDGSWILPNTKKVTEPLPETGGSGTGMLYLSAMLILALTGSSFLYRKNKNQ